MTSTSLLTSEFTFTRNIQVDDVITRGGPVRVIIHTFVHNSRDDIASSYICNIRLLIYLLIKTVCYSFGNSELAQRKFTVLYQHLTLGSHLRFKRAYMHVLFTSQRLWGIMWW